MLFPLLILIPNISTQSPYDAITDPTERIGIALSRLQTWHNADTGIWRTSGWWNAASIITTLGNLAQAEPDNEVLRDLVVSVFTNTFAHAPSKNPQPGIESPEGRSQRAKTTALRNATGLETGYIKAFDSLTHEMRTTYPPNWHLTAAHHTKSHRLIPSDNNQKLLTTAPDPSPWLDGFYDDDLWWALAWITAYDTILHTPYLSLAEDIFTSVARTWPTHCDDGGVYWSWERDYVNAITNELFLSTAAHLANRVGSAAKRDLYLDWAERSLAWFLDTGMLNEEGAVNDGLNDECGNNGRPVWSYNQGVIVGALVELSTASLSKSTSYLSLATRIAKAALVELGDENGVIHDVCEPHCAGDGTQFKGIFVRNLLKLHQVAPDEVFMTAIKVNAESVWQNDRKEDVLSVDWAGPFVRPGNASTQSAAMDVLVAAVAVG